MYSLLIIDFAFLPTSYFPYFLTVLLFLWLIFMINKLLQCWMTYKCMHIYNLYTICDKNNFRTKTKLTLQSTGRFQWKFLHNCIFLGSIKARAGFFKCAPLPSGTEKEAHKTRRDIQNQTTDSKRYWKMRNTCLCQNFFKT